MGGVRPRTKEKQKEMWGNREKKQKMFFKDKHIFKFFLEFHFRLWLKLSEERGN